MNLNKKSTDLKVHKRSRNRKYQMYKNHKRSHCFMKESCNSGQIKKQKQQQNSFSSTAEVVLTLSAQTILIWKIIP